MTKNDIYEKFSVMFPLLEIQCEDYKKIGSKTIAIYLNDGTRLNFLYYSDTNWNLGTKTWRKQPETINITKNK